MRVRIGFDTDEVGRYQIRDGKVECVAPTPAARADLERRLDLYLSRMAHDYGYDPRTTTAEDVLRFIAEHSTTGRNWAVLDDGSVDED